MLKRFTSLRALSLRLARPVTGLLKSAIWCKSVINGFSIRCQLPRQSNLVRMNR